MSEKMSITNWLSRGELEVTQYNGQVLIIEPTDAIFQAFVAYTVINLNT